MTRTYRRRTSLLLAVRTRWILGQTLGWTGRGQFPNSLSLGDNRQRYGTINWEHNLQMRAQFE